MRCLDAGGSRADPPRALVNCSVRFWLFPYGWQGSCQSPKHHTLTAPCRRKEAAITRLMRHLKCFPVFSNT